MYNLSYPFNLKCIQEMYEQDFVLLDNNYVF